MRTMLAAVALGLGLFCPAVALADGSSIVTLGLGGGVGIHKAGAPDEPSETAFVNQANLRLKFLWVLGLDYAVDLTRSPELLAPPAGELNFRAKMRATALLYPYSGERVAFYLGGGVGGGSLADLFRDAPSSSYHAGLGFEFHLGAHLSIDTSFMLVAPGMRSVDAAKVAKVEAALAVGGPEAVARLEKPGFHDFISLKNHEFMVRIFIFL